jgi:hypothetical protein
MVGLIGSDEDFFSLEIMCFVDILDVPSGQVVPEAPISRLSPPKGQ